MKRLYSKWLIISMAVVLCLVIAVAGCAAPTATPTTPTKPAVVKPAKFDMLSVADLSGPMVVMTTPQINAARYYVDWLNSKGGIRGVPITYTNYDTGYKVDQTMSQYSKLREMTPKPSLFWTMSSADAEALKDRVNEDMIIDFTQGNTSFAMYPVGYTLGASPAYVDAMGGFMDWVTSDWSKKTGQKVKLAILTLNNTTGKAILTDAMRAYAKEKGIEIVAEETFNPTDLDVTTQLTKVKTLGANWTYDNGHAAALPVICKSAETLGMMNHELYDTTPGKIHKCTNQNYQSAQSIIAAASEAKGVIGMGWAVMPEETNVEGVKIALEYAAKNNLKPIEINTGLVAGFNFMGVMAELIGRTVDAVGWDKVNGTTVREQAFKMQDYRPLGLYSYSFSAKKPEPNKIRVWQWDGSKITYVVPEYFTMPNLAPAQYK